MTEAAGAKPQEKPKSKVKPVRERLVRKELTAARRGATATELAEEQVKGGGTLQQRAAVRSVSGDGVVSRAPAPAHSSAESRFARDFSRVRTHTVAPPAGPVVQAQLTVNAPGDQYEQEADHVAEQVMTMTSVASQQEEPAMAKPLVQRQADGRFRADPSLEGRLAARQEGGRPLSAEVRSFMEPRFGADLSGVRVHTDSEAVQMTRELGAQAFTHGRDVYFGAGRYDPDTTAGRRLLAHELTHVVQQTGEHDVQTSGMTSINDPAEQEARAAERAFATGQRIPKISTRLSSSIIARGRGRRQVPVPHPEPGEFSTETEPSLPTAGIPYRPPSLGGPTSKSEEVTYPMPLEAPPIRTAQIGMEESARAELGEEQIQFVEASEVIRVTSWMQENWTFAHDSFTIIIYLPSGERYVRANWSTIFTGREDIPRHIVVAQSEDPTIPVIESLDNWAVFFYEQLHAAYQLTAPGGVLRPRFVDFLGRWESFMDNLPSGEVTHEDAVETASSFLRLHDAMYSFVQGSLSGAVPDERQRRVSVGVLEGRLEANLRRHRELTGMLRTLIQAIQQERERVEGVQQGLEVIAALELIQSAGNLALIGPTRGMNMPNVPGEIVVTGGELLSRAGVEMGPAVGTAGGTAVSLIQNMLDSGLIDRLAQYREALRCLDEESTMYCAELATLDVRTTLERLRELSGQIERDAQLLRALRPPEE